MTSFNTPPHPVSVCRTKTLFVRLVSIKEAMLTKGTKSFVRHTDTQVLSIIHDLKDRQQKRMITTNIILSLYILLEKT